jgi:hypothetical protein
VIPQKHKNAAKIHENCKIGLIGIDKAIILDGIFFATCGNITNLSMIKVSTSIRSLLAMFIESLGNLFYLIIKSEIK